MVASKPAGALTSQPDRLRAGLAPKLGCVFCLAACLAACTRGEKERSAPASTRPAPAASAPSATEHRGTSPRVQAGSPPEGRAANAPAASPAVRPQPPFRSELPRLDPELRKRPIPEQQRYLLDLLYAQEGPPPEARADLETTITGSAWLGFGNPKVAEPMLSQEACWALWRDRTPAPPDPGCGHPNMVRVTGSNACIDQYEFPNVLCEYPVVWVRSSEAKLLCEALGKRLCDAHEWEGACAGQVRPPGEDYAYARLPKGQGADYRRARRLLMEDWHNKERQLVWAYGSTKNHSLCATGAKKTASCTTVDFGICGSNDYPAGSFPDCRSPSGVYDQHGNVAEHMSLPLFPEELGGQGYTEMKGSWFLFSREETHPDDCRWRARNWHTTKLSDPNSHRNYHLGFRCCTDRHRAE